MSKLPDAMVRAAAEQAYRFWLTQSRHVEAQLSVDEVHPSAEDLENAHQNILGAICWLRSDEALELRNHMVDVMRKAGKEGWDSDTALTRGLAALGADDA